MLACDWSSDVCSSDLTLQKTCALIRKKLEKGKTISEIADDLEDTEENIAHLIEEFQLGRNGS